ncbi:hypothetical protein IX84_24565 [Phaeodactylibacter xiamenensis]|uniref:Uncharacterized protein n=1 Tax=Phaeodactylibacter xiamenensis TaxID=1524460 RepID=A0A098S190_9BACT|nr:hypothetical protein IX84_24565 [Phaeodactylibacter xiamenensis]
MKQIHLKCFNATKLDQFVTKNNSIIEFFTFLPKITPSFRLCLERIRHENQGIVVLAKSFLARLAGQIS